MQWGKLKEHFIPHEANQFKPRFLRFRMAALLLGLVLAIEALYFLHAFIVLPSSDYLAAILTSVLVEHTNEKRGIDKLGALRINPLLERAAQMKADDMAVRGYFSHYSPDGITPWHWFEEAGYDYAAAGENLAVNFTDSKDITEAWMHSPTHRSNILSGNYTEIGIATARGLYKGKEAIFVVQLFGRPSHIAAQIKTAATPETVIGKNTSPSIKPSLSVERPISPTTEAASSSPIKKATTSAAAPSAQVSTTTVAGALTAKLDAPIDISVETAVPVVVPGFFEQKWSSLIASPRHTVMFVYLLLSALISLALALAIFVKIRIQHPHLIANGFLLLAILASLAILNTALGIGAGVV